MNFSHLLRRRFELSKKIFLGFGIVILLFTLSTIYSNYALRKARSIDQEVTDIYLPLSGKVEQFQSLITNAGNLTYNWIYLPNEAHKKQLRKLHDQDFPSFKKELQFLTENIRGDQEVDNLNQLIAQFEKNLGLQSQIMNKLVSFDDYDNDELLFLEIMPIYDEQISPQLEEISSAVQDVNGGIQSKVDGFVESKYKAFDSQEFITIILTVLAVVLAIVASLFLIKGISKPIKVLNNLVAKMSKGELPDIYESRSTDEVGDIFNAIKKLRDSMELKASFASSIGRGDLSQEYELLGEHDVLGKSLITMRSNLKKVISETNSIVRVVTEEGKLDSQMDLDDKEGAWVELSASINDLFQSISKPIKSIERILTSMANGDLSQRYEEEARGEIKELTDSLNLALENLSKLLREISQNAIVIDESTTEMLSSGTEMSNSTGEIASAIAQMSNGAQSQVQQVDQSSQLVENILRTSKEVAAHSDAINGAAQKSVDDSERGVEMVNNVTSSINEIKGVSLSANESMQALSQRSGEIARVLGVITDIASQTNLLALNAAIEAAQAGDAGRGFAVVAEEIRKLAEDSRKSASEIERLIKDVSTDTKNAAQMMEAMNQSVEKGVGASLEAASVFNEMSASSSQTLNYSEKILSSSQEQSENIMSVVNITESIVVIAEQTSAGTEEVASSASELSAGMNNYIQKSNDLNDISHKLKEGLNQFNLVTDDSKKVVKLRNHEQKSSLRTG